MRKGLLLFIVFVAGTIIHSQTIELPGWGSNTITVPITQFSTSAELKFGNAEYNIVGFSMQLATTDNPNYVASSSGDHFTADMVDKTHHLLNGTDIHLNVTIQSNGEGSVAWHKSYEIHVAN